jgi:hypothetical protein
MSLLAEKFEKIETKLNEFEKNMSDRRDNRLPLKCNYYSKLEHIYCNC